MVRHSSGRKLTIDNIDDPDRSRTHERMSGSFDDRIRVARHLSRIDPVRQENRLTGGPPCLGLERP